MYRGDEKKIVATFDGFFSPKKDVFPALGQMSELRCKCQE